MKNASVQTDPLRSLSVSHRDLHWPLSKSLLPRTMAQCHSPEASSASVPIAEWSYLSVHYSCRWLIRRSRSACRGGVRLCCEVHPTSHIYSSLSHLLDWIGTLFSSSGLCLRG